MDYNETDAITTYMKDSLSVCKGKFFSQKMKSKIFHLPSDRKFLFVDGQHIYELMTFTRVCFPIQDHPWADLEDDVREVVRENRYCYISCDFCQTGRSMTNTSPYAEGKGRMLSLSNVTLLTQSWEPGTR